MRFSIAEILIHIAFWIFTAWLITSSFSIVSHEIEVIDGIETVNIGRDSSLVLQLLGCILLSILLFYTNNLLIARYSLRVGRIKLILYSISLFIISYLVYKIISGLLLNPGDLLIPPGLSFSIILFYFALSACYATGLLWYKSEQQKQQLALAKTSAELKLLRNQLQPHFLFNALNNLLSLVDHEKSPVLAKSIHTLSRLLRYVVYDTQNEKLPVEKEIEFIRNYVELQLLRFEDGEVEVHFLVEGEDSSQSVEPGIFIPFVENAFKYGTEPEVKSGIEINFDLTKNNQICFYCKNSALQTLINGEANGTGLHAIKERLNLVYPNRHTLNIGSGDTFTIELKIDTGESDNH